MNVKNRENFLLFNIKLSLFCLYLAISSQNAIAPITCLGHNINIDIHNKNFNEKI